MRGPSQHSLSSLAGVAGLFFHNVVASVPLGDWCREDCLVPGPDPSNWTINAEVDQLLEQSTACNKKRRTGNWVKKECTIPEVAGTYDFTPQERWQGLECQAAWDDAIQVWMGCYRAGSGNNSKFSMFMADFLHQDSNQNCGDSVHISRCKSSQCKTHNTEAELEERRTGACTYELWNSMVRIHVMISNYYYSLETMANRIKGQKGDFIATFAPKPGDETELFSLFLTLIQFPFGTAGARLFGNALIDIPSFAGIATGLNKAAWETATMSLVNSSFGVAQEESSKAEEARSVDSFNATFDGLSRSWIKQSDRLIQKLFDGSEKSIQLLSNLFKDGQMMAGKPAGRGLADNGHTNNWNRERAIERAFYAAAIPAAWAANRPTPVVIDFGPSCEVDARQYFTEKPSKYNHGWRCVNGRSYILAGVADNPPKPCAPSVPDDQCTIRSQSTLKVLEGVSDLQKPSYRWSRLTVDDLIIGAINTFERNGKKNCLNIKDNLPTPSDNVIFESYADVELDVRTPGYVLIPVCGVEEARANLAKGRERYGNSNNYPCNP